MKRDFDLVRRILGAIRDMPAGKICEDLSYDDFDQKTVYEHVNLLIEEGLVKGRVIRAQMGPAGVSISGLTWKGHDFVDAAADDGLWTKAKSTVLKPTASMTFDVLLEWLKAEIRTRIGLP